MTDEEYIKAAEDVAKFATGALDTPKEAVNALCEAVAIIAAENGFTVDGADDLISQALSEYTTPPAPIH
jgi:hypothetical protein